MNLAQMQREFQSWLVTASDDAAQRLAGGHVAGLSVYQNNYRVQLVDCLRVSYPHVQTWLGEDAFLAAAITHIDNSPPHAWTLDAYGDDFGETLALLYPDNPEVHELAWIELALSRAFVAPDAGPLTLEALSDIDWESARLHLAPSFTAHVVTTNAADIWSALQQGIAPPESEMLAKPAAVVVWRRQFTVVLEAVDAVEHAALLQLWENGSFDALCSMLVARLGESEGVAKAGALLAGWVGKELLAGVAA
ncbi:putative DNA-binding domain-containing protein [Dyella flava]|uniref:DNA-binding domain-containing protein n=1 Tax=Dyella flava TaxID=1920170 RepID=A0ABS2KAH0_9GAMM|nr:DNA-binding domain-containing protein [Dyella flava]MBM7127328.1 putative DNA-binding domain-containing protein [Dyella flava]GLQ52089.1 hypothetical protein GCM10010872_35380 [Dyella flava]